MKKTFNYTGRKKIFRKNIELEVIEDRDGGNHFLLHRLDLDRNEIPSTARLIVEPYVRGVYQDRMSVGPIGEFSPGVRGELENHFEPLQLLFRLKVNDKDGRILAYADQISPSNFEGDDESGDRHSILPVHFTRDIAQEVWRVDFREDNVVLQLNENIDGIRQLIRQDANFAGLVYPQAARTILNKLFIGEQLEPEELEVDETWRGRWYRFIAVLHGTGLDLPDEIEPLDRNRRYHDWIEDVVKSFATRHSFRDQIIVGSQ